MENSNSKWASLLGARQKINATNTGPETLNVNGLGAVPVRKADGGILEALDLLANAIVDLNYDGTGWQISGAYVSSLTARHTASYTNAGTFTFTVPAGVYWVLVRIWGGSGGAANNNAVGRGGSGGGYAEGWISVSPGQNLTVVVGAGGNGGAADQFLVCDKATVNGKKQVLRGLTIRRDAERKQFLSEAATVIPETVKPAPVKTNWLTSLIKAIYGKG